MQTWCEVQHQLRHHCFRRACGTITQVAASATCRPPLLRPSEVSKIRGSTFEPMAYATTLQSSHLTNACSDGTALIVDRDHPGLNSDSAGAGSPAGSNWPRLICRVSPASWSSPEAASPPDQIIRVDIGVECGPHLTS